MSNKFFNHLLLMLLAIPVLTLSSCNFNLFEGMHSSSEGPNLPSETVESEESIESVESTESEDSIESVESGDSYDPEYMTPGLIIENGVVTRYEGTDTEVVIPSIYNGYNVTSIGDYAFSECGSLTSITIPDSVTSIGNGAFFNCTSLTSIIIPNSVTSIGDVAFAACISLTSVTVGNSVTSIGNGAFASCISLTSITIPDSVTSIGDFIFQDCISLTSINVDSKNIYYTSIEGILYNNDATTLICYPGGKAGEVIIPNSVTSIGNSAFVSCYSLTSIIIPDSVTSIGDYAFASCHSLTSIIIPNSVTSIGDYAFDSCTSLTSIIIPNSVTSIYAYAFSNCTSLTIYCEAEYEPSGWDGTWNPDNRPVEWGVNLIKYDTINVDAGGDALALINDSSIKLHAPDHTPDGWLFGGWRLYLACDSQGRVTYCVYLPPVGYGGPTDNTYLYHEFYKDPNNENPSIELLDGFGPWVPDGNAHIQFNINIPKGGFGLVAHGTKAKEILVAITGGYITEEIVDSEDCNAINDNSNPCNAILTVVGDKIIIVN